MHKRKQYIKRLANQLLAPANLQVDSLRAEQRGLVRLEKVRACRSVWLDRRWI